MPQLTLVPAALLLLAGLLWRQDVRLEPRDGAIFLAFALLTIAQIFTVPGATVTASVGFFVRLAIGYAAIRLARDAPLAMVQVLTAIAAIGVLLFAVDQSLLVVGVDLAAAFEPVSIIHGEGGVVHVAVHNFNSPLDRHRNSGLFWEPGALSGYCLLAILLLGFARDRVSATRYWVSLFVLSVAVLSTQSTTGYLLLPLLLMFHLVRSSSARGGGFATIVVALAAPAFVVVVLAALELPFMRQKIAEQVYSVQDERAGWETTRFGTFLVDIQDIRERPLIGWGANPRVRPSQEYLSETAQVAQGNGFTNWWVRFGATGLALFLIAAGSGIRRYGKASSAEITVALLFLCILLQGEMFLNYPLFLGLMFLRAAPLLQRYQIVPISPASGAVPLVR